jgi:phage tail sheath protein FI
LNGVRTYGWRTLANQTTDSDWTFLNGSRVIMAVKSALSVAAENFEFSKLDGLQKVTRKFQGVLSGVLIGFWNSGDLFGDTSKEAFSVDTGPAVNTATTFAQGQLSANVGLRTSGMAEQVIINIAKVPITESLAA